MMLRSLVDEVVRRRLWPIPVIAILIMIAAPVLFMKSGTAAPVAVVPPAAAGKLPVPAQRVVSTSDKDAVPRDRVKRKGQDPFAPPRSGTAAAAETTATAPATSAPASTPASAPASTSAPASSGTTSPVVIQNSDGSRSTMAVPKAAARKAAAAKRRAAAARKAAAAKRKAAAEKTTPKVVAPEQTTSSAAARSTVTYVDVRFARRQNTMLRYRVPRLQTFRAGGMVAAMFVHYSAARDVAVFAIAPSTTVAGDVSCRKVKNVCRYVDIPAGSYARLRLRGKDGSLLSRRLDVVSIRRLALAGNEDAMPRVTPVATATCLLKGLLKLPASLPSIPFDACD